MYTSMFSLNSFDGFSKKLSTPPNTQDDSTSKRTNLTDCLFIKGNVFLTSDTLSPTF